MIRALLLAGAVALVGCGAGEERNPRTTITGPTSTVSVECQEPTNQVTITIDCGPRGSFNAPAPGP